MLTRSLTMRILQFGLGLLGGGLLMVALLGLLGVLPGRPAVSGPQSAFVMAPASDSETDAAQPERWGGRSGLPQPASDAQPPAQPSAADPHAHDSEDDPHVTTQTTTKKYSRSAYDITPLPRDEVERLAATLDEEAYRITQKAGTEPAFCGTLLDNKKDGVYCCVVCGLPLFTSDHKFNSGSGWPSFYMTFDREHVVGKEDNSIPLMPRVEIECARCTAHLGHVFDDGPEPTGLRFCLNSASLVFYEHGEDRPPQSSPVKTETAYFAGGCFWGIEHYFQKGEGVIDAVSGYMQGETVDPTYHDVCFKDTGHAEAVMVVFDPKTISYERLLQAFFDMHDPTQLNRQGVDIGSQYRSGIYTTSEAQLEAARAYVRKLGAEGRFDGAIVTEIEPAETFYTAEDDHQDYIETTGRACQVKNPW